MKHIEIIKDYHKITKVIRNDLKKYLQKHNRKSLVIGVSGGIDSALVCALVKPVCDELCISLIGRSISIQGNKKDEVQRSRLIGNNFCSNFRHINVDLLYDNFKNYTQHQIEDDNTYKIRLGNIKARMRMILLYDLAHVYRGLVLGTENLTEYYLGFFTLHGDSAADYSPIQQLWKTEVYNLAEYLISTELNPDEAFALKSCIDSNATDGLGISETDLDQILPSWKTKHDSTSSGYKEIDKIFIDHFNGKKISKDHTIIQRMNSTNFKRKGMIFVSRNKFLK